MQHVRTLLIQIGALALIAAAFLLITRTDLLSRFEPAPGERAPEAQTASALATATSAAEAAPVQKAPRAKQKPAAEKPPADQAERIENPYSFPPLPFAQINGETRAALVNILCTPRSGGLRPISGSGVLIDPRGVILTNAHVAQYVLLSQSPRIDLSCVVRTGSPASTRWTPRVLYMPPAWVERHAREINEQKPLGTGEFDYALLVIAGPAGDSPPSASPTGGFPYLPFDTREAIGFQGDSVLVASYPAEFVGGLATELGLYAASSVTQIRQLLTFEKGTVDLLSLGGIIEAQSGSSGGAVVNAWGRLIGIITTTSDGATTAERDLRAATLSYINRDLAAQTRFDLPTILGGDVFAQAEEFDAFTAPRLLKLFFDELAR